MAANSQINSVTVQGNLTRDPELRSLPSGSSVCSLRIANNRAFKTASGEWDSRPNYFNVTVWGKQGENIAQYLGKGSGIVVTGELRWHEWEAQDGTKRQDVEINAREVVWLPKRDDDGRPAQRAPVSDIPADTAGFKPQAPQPAGAPDQSYGAYGAFDGGSGGANDDIPF